MGHTYRGGKSGCKLVTLFGGYSYDGLNATIGVQHTEVPNVGASKLVLSGTAINLRSHFLDLFQKLGKQIGTTNKFLSKTSPHACNHK